jgi:RNA polymerase sigma-70 factor, ECF subfamily
MTNLERAGQDEKRPHAVGRESSPAGTHVPQTNTDALQTSPVFDFETVFVREASFVWNSLRRLGVPTADVDDALHDVFVAVYRQRASYDPSRSLRGWLFGFAHRVAANQRRAIRRRRESAEPVDEPVSAAPLPDELVRERDKHRIFLELLETVPLERRAVLVLHDFEGVAMDEVAASLTIPVNTAYSRLRVARSELLAAADRLRSKRGEL